jgi:hypothetical protein
MSDSRSRSHPARGPSDAFSRFLAIQNLNEPTKSKEQKAQKQRTKDVTMATLMASMSSDDEAPAKNKKGKVVEDSSDDEDDEVDESFEFGGILVSLLRGRQKV